MQAQGCESTRWAPPGVAPLHIEGIPVESLFEDIYREARGHARGRGLAAAFEVIAWEVLVAAADRRALVEAYLAASAYVIANTAAGAVDMRAFPSCDNTCVTFEVATRGFEPKDSLRDTDTADGIRAARSIIESMGGTLVCVQGATGAYVGFWLPQWLTVADSPRERIATV